MKRSLLLPAVALALAACSTPPPRNLELEEARVLYEQARGNPYADRVAAVELARARQALTRAEAGWADEHDVERTRHDAYVARRQAEIALARPRPNATSCSSPRAPARPNAPPSRRAARSRPRAARRTRPSSRWRRPTRRAARR
jgi:hypothetical protein